MSGNLIIPSHKPLVLSHRSQNKSSVTSKTFILGRLQIRLWRNDNPETQARFQLIQTIEKQGNTNKRVRKILPK